jgi:predicted dehydrogenase
VDGIVVAVTTIAHADVVDEVLPLGVPVFVEKPLTSDPASAAAIVARAGDRVFVMDKWRYHPGVEALRDLLATGRLGPIDGIRTTRTQWGNPHTDVDPIWILLPHDLAIIREVTGSPMQPVAAVAEVSASGVVGLTGLMRAPSGAWGHVAVSGRSPEGQRRIEVLGRDAVAVLGGGWDDHVTIHEDVAGSAVEEVVPCPGELPLVAELRTFVSHLDGGPAPRSSAAEGAADVATIAELRRLAGIAG